MADIGKIEYRVREVTRYHVTRYYESVDGRTGGIEQRGEYHNPNIAYEVAYALCKAEHDRFGGALDDGRFIYPERADKGCAMVGGDQQATPDTAI